MRIITRYVLLELLKIFSVSLTVLTLVMIIFGVVNETIRQGLGPTQIIQLLPFVLPEALRYTVPATILFSVSSVYGRMSSFNEMVALKAMGISPMVVVWPALALATGLSFATVWLNDLAVSWGREGVQRVAIEAVEEIAYGMLRTQRAYNSKQFSINVKRVDGERLIRPTLTFQSSGDRPAITVMAEWAELRSDLKKKLLVVICHDFTVHGDGTVSGQDSGTFELAIPLEDASRAGKQPATPAYMAMSIIPEQIELQYEKIDQLEHELALHAADQLLVGDFAELATPQWEIDLGKIKNYYEHLFRLQTEPWRRWANGFSCLFFVLIGMPTAITRRNADFLTSFFLCFLPILIVYYPMLMLGVDGSKNGNLPPWSVWLGNVVFLVVGYWQLRKVRRY